MVRAAARGIIDFTKADLRDPMWMRHVRTVIDSLVDDNLADRYRTTFQLQCSLIANSALQPKSFEDGLKRARMLHDLLVDVIAPWDADERASQSKSALEQGIEEYKRTAGNPDDADFKAKLATDYQTLQAMATAGAAKVETEEERIERLINARDALREQKQKANT